MKTLSTQDLFKALQVSSPEKPRKELWKFAKRTAVKVHRAYRKHGGKQ